MTRQKTASNKNAKKLFWKEEKITNRSAYTMYTHLQILLVKLHLHLCCKCHIHSLSTDVGVLPSGSPWVSRNVKLIVTTEIKM